jgi:hypothetical protein
VPRKLNCWEFKNCGREPGGLMTGVLGECPVASAMKHDGINHGRAAGRICWKVRNSSAGRVDLSDNDCSSCHECAFYRRVIYEEKENVQSPMATLTT